MKPNTAAAFCACSGFYGLPLALALCWPLAAGCYNADILLQARTEAAKVIRMEEVDLGTFAITLPHKLGNATDYIVEFHIFGLVESRDRKNVARSLQARGPELRSKMLLTIRTLNESDFDEPKLTTLRTSIASVVNGTLEEKLIKKVGFYHYSFGSFN